MKEEKNMHNKEKKSRKFFKYFYGINFKSYSMARSI